MADRTLVAGEGVNLTEVGNDLVVSINAITSVTVQTAGNFSGPTAGTYKAWQTSSSGFGSGSVFDVVMQVTLGDIVLNFQNSSNDDLNGIYRKSTSLGTVNEFSGDTYTSDTSNTIWKKQRGAGYDVIVWGGTYWGIYTDCDDPDTWVSDTGRISGSVSLITSSTEVDGDGKNRADLSNFQSSDYINEEIGSIASVSSIFNGGNAHLVNDSITLAIDTGSHTTQNTACVLQVSSVG